MHAIFDQLNNELWQNKYSVPKALYIWRHILENSIAIIIVVIIVRVFETNILRIVEYMSMYQTQQQT
jgi:hypothetical protein